MTAISKVVRGFRRLTGISREQLDVAMRTSWEAAWKEKRVPQKRISNAAVFKRIERLTAVWETLGKPAPDVFINFLKAPQRSLNNFQPRDLLSNELATQELLAHLKERLA